MGVLKNFLSNKDGNYAVIFSLAALPIFGSVAVTVDYSNLSRLNYNLSDAVDSMCTVVAREFIDGKPADDVKAAGKKFFETNIDPQYLSTATATFTLPDDAGNTAKTLRCKGELQYKPIFAPTMAFLTGGSSDDYVVVLNEATMKMKNLAEVALVLDNSGSMDFDNLGKVVAANSPDTRMVLLKSAAKKLVTKMIDFGTSIQQTTDPVKFSVVPFASMVNVGPNNANQSWMDTTGISPIHHENLNWGTPGATNPTGYTGVASAMPKLNSLGQPLTRFSIYNALKVRGGGTELSATAATSQCSVWRAASSTNDFTKCSVFNRSGVFTDVAPPTTPIVNSVNPATYSWKGCVEARPDGHDLTDIAATTGPTKFVPSFAPDNFNSSYYGSGTYIGEANNWWPDYETKDFTAPLNSWNNNNSTQVRSNASMTTARSRETPVAKYFAVKPFTSSGSGSRQSQWSYYTNPWYAAKDPVGTYNGNPVAGSFGGPNLGCTVNPITPLTGSKTTLTNAIDAMASFGGTNAAEGLAWGWRTLSPQAPFTDGAPTSRKDIDRVIILITDGANQIGEITDKANNKSIYSAYGALGYKYTSTLGAVGTAVASAADSRVFQGTSVSNPSFTTAKYNQALNERMDKICTNIKAQKYILMTVALDLNTNTNNSAHNTEAQSAIDALKKCAGTSRTKKNADGTPFVLSWNTKSTTLDATFKAIADELSNLRFTQ
jgi:Flp pilus assembly protein TadG